MLSPLQLALLAAVLEVSLVPPGGTAGFDCGIGGMPLGGPMKYVSVNEIINIISISIKISTIYMYICDIYIYTDIYIYILGT